MGLVDRLRHRLARPVDAAESEDPSAGALADHGFVHAPDAEVDDVPTPKRVGFDGRELPQSGGQSGHFPSGGGVAGF